jgi:hypothetical protein
MNALDRCIKTYEKINPKTSHSKNGNLNYVLEVTRTTLLVKAISHWNVWIICANFIFSLLFSLFMLKHTLRSLITRSWFA